MSSPRTSPFNKLRASGREDSTPKSMQLADETTERRKPVYGALKGKIWISDDFDAPLEDIERAYFDAECTPLK